jgi:SAM-dependent methyltransferase
MQSFPLAEAERQVLIAFIELDEPFETPNNTHYTFYPKTLEEAALYFRSVCEDWGSAYTSLANRGLLHNKQQGFSLTEVGAAIARQERLDHPPIWYWYREYYTITSRSQAYAHFCEALYGRDLCQTNFSDMAQLDLLIQVSNLKPGDRVLDLGCGKGQFAEYLSDVSGARVWGIDYVPEAIQQALERTNAKRNRLDFQVGNFDHLNYPPGSFDRLVSIDTIYMPNNLPATLGVMRDLLAPGGKMFIFYLTLLFDPAQRRELLHPDQNDLARALRLIGLPYRTWDLSEPTFHLMRRKHQLAKSMRPEFEAEGTLFLYDHLIAESDGGTAPYDPQTGTLSRYLYEVG